jgi:hypothetical protein
MADARTGHRAFKNTVASALAAIALAGCASAVVAPPEPRPAPVAGIRRVVVVAAGPSRFAVDPGSREMSREVDRIVKWLPYQEIVGPIAQAVFYGLAWLVDSDRASSTVPRDVVPGAVVADAFARALAEGGPFDQIARLEREPAGEARRDADAIVRIAVPSWGLVRVRDGKPADVAAFADVRAALMVRETGAIAWEHVEDVTHPERVPLDAMTGDRALARERLVETLERAGRRLASELVYAQGRGR